MSDGPRESLEFDAVVVGGGPAGLAAAIRLGQLAAEHGRPFSVCLIDKGAEIGSHILSGNVFDPRALDELIPEWRNQGAPIRQKANRDRFRLLTPGLALPLPLPPAMRNRGCYLISLGKLCRWLAERATALGVEIFPGFTATDGLFDSNGRMVGVVTGDMGRLADGSPGPSFTPGIELRARHVLVAEGCRGSLARKLIRHFDLEAAGSPQTYGLGLKEIWEIPPERHRPGSVTHAVGWPLDGKTYGGSFIYHMEENRVALGLVVGLDYADPLLDPFREMQRFKTHAWVRPLLEGGRRLGWGAKTLVEGGLQSLPWLEFEGGALIGDAAGTMDVGRIKGAHTAMKSGMLAAECLFADRLREYPGALRRSWVWRDLERSRNLRPGFRFGLWAGLALAGLDAYVFRGRAPWTIGHSRPDHEATRKGGNCPPVDYPAPDGRLTFDRPSSVHLAGIKHREDQPCHLHVQDPELPTLRNLVHYAGLETRFCPAGVYEFIEEAGQSQLQINAGNCIHCKTCDIKDPSLNIVWEPPEGGSGPNWADM